MSRIAIYSTFCFLCFSPAAFAVCEKYGYDEVKKWSADELDRAYCRDSIEFMRRVLGTSIQYGSQYDPRGAPGIAACETQMKRYALALQNVHRKKTPYCDPTADGKGAVPRRERE